MTATVGRNNPNVRLARSLRERKTRARQGLFLAEGIRLATAALEHEADVRIVISCSAILTSSLATSTVESLKRSGAVHIDVSRETFRDFSTRENPQGIAVIAAYETRPIDRLSVDGLCGLCLIRPQDPGNLGSIIRTCDAVGATGIILVDTSVDPFDPKSVRATMGSIFGQSIYRTTLHELRGWARENQISLVGISGEASTTYRELKYVKPLVLVLGSEREGLDPDIVLDQRVSIPMSGAADSLNLSVAAGIVLYEVFNQLGAS